MLVYWSLRSTATCVICFHWSLLLAFSLNFSSSCAILRALFTQSSHLSCCLPRFLEPSCFFVSDIYPIICLKSVCLSCDVRKVQVAILGRLPREMSQTDSILPRYFLSRVRVSIRPRIFLYAKKPQTIVARPAAVDRRSVADKQLNWSGHNPSACVAQCQELSAKT